MSNGDNIGAGPDPNTTVTEAQAWFQVFMSMMSQGGPMGGVPGFVATHAAVSKALEHAKLPSTVAKIAGALISALADIAAGLLNGLEDVKQNSGSGMNDLIAAAIKDLLGVDINLNQGDSGNPALDPAATGAAVFDVLTSAFGGLNQISPDQGAANAKQFIGIGMNFAVVTAFLGILGGLVPYVHLDELKEIGETVNRVLGLGRLTHTAITPLVRNMIAQPLDLWLRAQLRPDRLGEAPLVRAMRAGYADEAGVRQQLAEKGYPDDAIDFLLADLSVKLGLSDLVLLLLNGDIQEQDVINNLTINGMPEDQAALQLKATELSKVQTQQNALLTWAEDQYANGFITETQWNSILSNLMMSDLEEAAVRARVGWKQETPTKSLSFADVKAAIVDNVVSFDYLDTWFTHQHYDSDAQNVMSWQVLQAIKTAEQKVLFAQYKAKVLQTANKPVPPWITAAEQPIP